LTDHIAIGVLSGLVHRDVVDDVINECGKREKRSRLLPAHVVVYYVLALNLFFGDAYEEAMRQLVNGLRFLGNWRYDWTVPSTSALSQARTRLGEAPLKLLFERIAVPMARAGTRGAWFRGLRVMALDGVVFDVPDTPANDEAFGRGGNDQGRGPFPQVRLVAVAECGTHALVDAVLGPVATGEQTLAAQLIGRLTFGMLVLADRNFYSYQAWQQASATGAELLWRVSGRLPLPVLHTLPDGSYRSLLISPKIRGRRREMLISTAAAGGDLEPTQATLVRVVEYTIEDRPGSGELFYLITTITDHELAPALDLATVYHQRWEIELSFDEIETHQTGT
jgi:Insertion element 4 transposase N-terminal/Transposase DDE domain